MASRKAKVPAATMATNQQKSSKIDKAKTRYKPTRTIMAPRKTPTATNTTNRARFSKIKTNTHLTSSQQALWSSLPAELHLEIFNLVFTSIEPQTITLYHAPGTHSNSQAHYVYRINDPSNQRTIFNLLHLNSLSRYLALEYYKLTLGSLPRQQTRPSRGGNSIISSSADINTPIAFSPQTDTFIISTSCTSATYSHSLAKIFPTIPLTQKYDLQQHLYLIHHLTLQSSSISTFSLLSAYYWDLEDEFRKTAGQWLQHCVSLQSLVLVLEISHIEAGWQEKVRRELEKFWNKVVKPRQKTLGMEGTEVPELELCNK